MGEDTVTNYRNGATFERQIAARLTEDGYLVVRAAGSKGIADLVALKFGQVLLVNVKLPGAGAVPPAEWNELFAAAEQIGAVALVVSRPKRGAKAWQRITAPKTGVRGVKPPCVPWRADELAELDGVTRIRLAHLPAERVHVRPGDPEVGDGPA